MRESYRDEHTTARIPDEDLQRWQGDVMIRDLTGALRHMVSAERHLKRYEALVQRSSGGSSRGARLPE